MEYEIEGLEEIDLEIERLTKRYDRYYENAALKQMQQSSSRPRKKTDVVKEYKEERERIFRNGEIPRRRPVQIPSNTRTKPLNDDGGNGLSLSFEEIVKEAEMAFKISGVLHLSYLSHLNKNLARKVYNYFMKKYPCDEIRTGTLRYNEKK